MRNYKYKPKTCPFCGTEFLPTGQNQKFCTKQHQYEWQKLMGLQKEYRDRANAKLGRVVGIGSGGLMKAGPSHRDYTHGRDSFRNFARKLVKQGVPCSECGKDLTGARRGEWCGHHKDHDQTNNDIRNLAILCKRCHQIHHESWRNLPQYKNVQRLDREIVGNSVPEAQSTQPNGGDDIV